MSLPIQQVAGGFFADLCHVNGSVWWWSAAFPSGVVPDAAIGAGNCRMAGRSRVNRLHLTVLLMQEKSKPVVDMLTPAMILRRMASEQKLFDDSPLHPAKILSGMLAERGWTQDELAQRNWLFPANHLRGNSAIQLLIG
jgi:hypothetical protein